MSVTNQKCVCVCASDRKIETKYGRTLYLVDYRVDMGESQHKSMHGYIKSRIGVEKVHLANNMTFSTSDNAGLILL